MISAISVIRPYRIIILITVSMISIVFLLFHASTQPRNGRYYSCSALLSDAHISLHPSQGRNVDAVLPAFQR